MVCSRISCYPCHHQGDGSKADKLAALDKQIVEAESNVMKWRDDVQSVSQRCFNDAEGAHKEREVVISAASVALADAQIKHARDAIAQWEELVPLARQVAANP